MQPRILFVEDQPAIRELLSVILQRDGFEVTTAASAREAKRHLSKGTFDFILTDMWMETPDAGFEVLRAAREICPHALRVVLSAFPMPASDCKEAGADLQFIKGTDLAALLKVLQRSTKKPIGPTRTSGSRVARA